MEIAELTVAYRDQGVVGFDIAGAEAGYPPTRHLDAFEYLQRENAHFTIHAGEAFGLPSIWQAIQWCGADRLGHGVRIIDDVTVAPSGGVTLGRLASYVRDKRIPLEMCPSSNIQTGAAPSIAEHPIGLLKDLRFRVTVNTDNRLMSGTSMSREMGLLVDAFGYGMADLRWFTINAMKSAFLPFDERLALIDEVIKPAYAILGTMSWSARGSAVQALRGGAPAHVPLGADSVCDEPGDPVVGLVGRHRRAAERLGVRDHLGLEAHQHPATAQQGQRGLAALAEVTGEAPEGHHPVVPHADRVGQDAPVAAQRDDLLGEDPLGHEVRRDADRHLAVPGAAVLGDLVDRHLGGTVAADLLEGVGGLLAQPRLRGWSQSGISSPPGRVTRGIVGSPPSL